MNGSENLTFTIDGIYITKTMHMGEAVMHIGEKTLMENLANLVTENGGHILEIGFGMHLSADEIQKKPNVKSHTIIEIHPDIYHTAVEWAKDKPNVKILLGDWIDIIPSLNKKYDGILHDTHRDKNIHNFLDSVKEICNLNCIVGFFQCKFFDKRIGAVRYEIDSNEFNKLPYRNNGSFENNQYELKYSIFNGIDFYNKINTNKLI
jgi:spermidine synthase